MLGLKLNHVSKRGHWYQHTETKAKLPQFRRRHFKCILLNENAWLLFNTSLKFVSEVRINNIPVLFQTMARHRPSVKPLSDYRRINAPFDFNELIRNINLIVAVSGISSNPFNKLENEPANVPRWAW